MKYLKGGRTGIFNVHCIYERNGKCMLVIIEVGDDSVVADYLHDVEAKPLLAGIDKVCAHTKGWLSRWEVKPNVSIHMRRIAIARSRDESGEASL